MFNHHQIGIQKRSMTFAKTLKSFCPCIKWSIKSLNQWSWILLSFGIIIKACFIRDRQPMKYLLFFSQLNPNYLNFVLKNLYNKLKGKQQWQIQNLIHFTCFNKKLFEWSGIGRQVIWHCLYFLYFCKLW